MSETLSQPSAPRRRWATPLLVLFVVLVAACGGSDSPAAITVSSESINQSTIDDELAAIAKNKVIRDQAAVKGKVRPEIVATWLTADASMEIARQAVKQAKGSPTDADRGAALNWAQEYFGSAAAFDAFPAW